MQQYLPAFLFDWMCPDAYTFDLQKFFGSDSRMTVNGRNFSGTVLMLDFICRVPAIMLIT
jgi:hypothetical protein